MDLVFYAGGEKNSPNSPVRTEPKAHIKSHGISTCSVLFAALLTTLQAFDCQPRIADVGLRETGVRLGIQCLKCARFRYLDPARFSEADQVPYLARLYRLHLRQALRDGFLLSDLVSVSF
jgi:hypothetical protein